VNNLKKGAELLASFTTSRTQSPPLVKQCKSENCETEKIRVVPPAVKKHESKSGSGITPQPGRKINIQIIAVLME